MPMGSGVPAGQTMREPPGLLSPLTPAHCTALGLTGDAEAQRRGPASQSSVPRPKQSLPGPGHLQWALCPLTGGHLLGSSTGATPGGPAALAAGGRRGWTWRAQAPRSLGSTGLHRARRQGRRRSMCPSRLPGHSRLTWGRGPRHAACASQPEAWTLRSAPPSSQAGRALERGASTWGTGSLNPPLLGLPLQHALGDPPSSSHFVQRGRSTVHILRFGQPLGGQSRRPRPPPRGGGSRICSGLTWVSSGSRTGAPVSTPGPAALLRPRCGERRREAAGQPPRKDPFSPQTGAPKSILLLLGSSPVYNSEATRLHDASSTTARKALGPALPPLLRLPRGRRTQALPARPSDGRTMGGERGARAPAPSPSGPAPRGRGRKRRPEQAQAKPGARPGGAAPGPPSCARRRGAGDASPPPETRPSARPRRSGRGHRLHWERRSPGGAGGAGGGASRSETGAGGAGDAGSRRGGGGGWAVRAARGARRGDRAGGAVRRGPSAAWAALPG